MHDCVCGNHIGNERYDPVTGTAIAPEYLFDPLSNEVQVSAPGDEAKVTQAFPRPHRVHATNPQ